MLLKKLGIVATGVALVASLAACDFTAEGTLECHTAEDGKIVCTAQGTGTPVAPPTTTPPPTTTTPPPVDPVDPVEPTDPNDGLPAATVQAKQSGPDKVRVWWSTERTDVTGWYISRDGVDSSGYGTWGTELARDKTDVTFNLLNPGVAYTFTVVGHTADGDLPPVKATVEVAVTEPPVDPVDPVDPVEPGNPDAVTAAEKFGWGTPIAAASDEFNYTGTPDPAKWGLYSGAGHAGNGRRVAERNTVDGSKLVQTGLANGDSAGMASKFDQQYGRWEARVRSSSANPGAGRQYHPLLIIWPESNRWPQDGEYDFLENGAPGAACAESFIHYPHNPGAVQQEFKRETNCGAPLTEWHNVAIEWTPTHVKGFIDGREWFSYSGGATSTRKAIQAMPSGHLTIQLDNFHGSNMTPAKYEIDWVRTYSLR